ncbi:MAG: SMI1/KNR4 family protein [Burkholderiales bacterium]|nr:SMI1/KNR4 family protein [Burkholderiales bacterium]
MDLTEFSVVVEDARAKHLHWFAGAERLAQAGEIESAEKALGLRLHETYRAFLRNFGGGYFGFTNVFSVVPGSEWNVVDRQTKHEIPRDFLSVSDDETGGLYGFRVNSDRMCAPEIYYLYLSGAEEQLERKFDSLFDFVVATGLKRPL